MSSDSDVAVAAELPTPPTSPQVSPMIVEIDDQQDEEPSAAQRDAQATNSEKESGSRSPSQSASASVSVTPGTTSSTYATSSTRGSTAKIAQEEPGEETLTDAGAAAGTSAEVEGPRPSATVDSDFVTASPELLRSQLEAASREPFNPVETSPSVFASQRPLVPYFFGRPDPLQRSYAGQYNFVDLVAGADMQTQEAQLTSARRRARRTAAVFALRNPTEEDLAIMRAQNPELFIRLAYGHPVQHREGQDDSDADGTVSTSDEEDEEEEEYDDDEDFVEELAHDFARRASGVSLRPGTASSGSHSLAHAHAYGTHAHHPTPAHQAHAHISSKTLRNPTAPAPHRPGTSATATSTSTSTSTSLKSNLKTAAGASKTPHKRTKTSNPDVDTRHHGTAASNLWASSSSATAPPTAHRSAHGKLMDAHNKLPKFAPVPAAPPKSAAKEKEELEERQKVREFWRSLPEEQRNSLIKVEKEQILKKMKEQQRQPTCACELCGKRRNAIEEELEMLYDAYYQELEKFSGNVADSSGLGFDLFAPASDPNRSLSNSSSSSSLSASTAPSTTASSTASSSAARTAHRTFAPSHPPALGASHHPHAAAAHTQAHTHDYHHQGASSSRSVSRTSAMGSNRTSLLAVADDFLKNDGRKFIEMMEELADAKLRREMRMEVDGAVAAAYAEDGYESSTYDEEEDDEEEIDEELGEEDIDDMEEDEEDEEYDEDDDTRDINYDGTFIDSPSHVLSDEMKIEEGKQMLQMFAAKMFEQRITAAYREKVTREQQEKLIAEEEERTRQEQAKKEQKARKKEREKAKKQQKLLEEVEERKRREKEEEERQRLHKLEVERANREREEKRQEERRKEEEERERQRIALEAKRKAEQDRKKAEKAAKAQAKLEEQQRLEKERLERERQANFAANERRKAEAAKAEAAKAEAAKAEAEAKAKADLEAKAKLKADAEAAAASEIAAKNSAAAAAQATAQAAAAKPTPKATTATAPVGGTKKKQPKSPLLPLEPPKEPPAVKKTTTAKPTATANPKNTAATHAADVSRDQPGSKKVAASHPKAKSTHPIPNPVGPTPAASVASTGPGPKVRVPAENTPLPQNPRPLPSYPPKPGAATIPGYSFGESSILSNTPLLSSKDLAAPVGQSWDALSAGFASGVPSLSAFPADASTDAELPVNSLNALWNGAPAVDLPTDMGVLDPNASAALVRSQSPDEMMTFAPDQFLNNLLLNSHPLSPDLTATNTVPGSATVAPTAPFGGMGSTFSTATGLRGLLSDEDEVVHGHTSAHFNTASSSGTTPAPGLGQQQPLPAAPGLGFPPADHFAPGVYGAPNLFTGDGMMRSTPASLGANDPWAGYPPSTGATLSSLLAAPNPLDAPPGFENTLPATHWAAFGAPEETPSPYPPGFGNFNPAAHNSQPAAGFYYGQLPPNNAPSIPPTQPGYYGLFSPQ